MRITLELLDEIDYAMSFLPDPNLYAGDNVVTLNFHCNDKDGNDVEAEVIFYVEASLDRDAIKLLPRGSSPVYKKRWVKFMFYEVGSERDKDLFFFRKTPYYEEVPQIDLTDEELIKIKEAIAEQYFKFD